MSLCKCFSQVKDERLVLIEVLLLFGSKMYTLLVMLKNSRTFIAKKGAPKSQ